MADPSNGLWLVPSRKRPEKLRRFFQALADTDTKTPGLVLIHHAEFQDPALVTAYDTLTIPWNWRLIKTQGDSQGDKLREVVDLYVNKDWVGLLGDDQVPDTMNWDLKLVERIKGWNLVSCYDDGWQINQRGGRIAGTMMWSGELLRTVGYIFPPGMHHVYLDDIWEELGGLTGCWSFAEHACPDVVIKHLHVTRGLSEEDETHRIAYNYFAQTDYPVWHSWRAEELPAVADRVRALIARYRNA